MRTDWILFTLLGLLWLAAGGIHLRLPRRQDNRGQGSGVMDQDSEAIISDF